MNRFRSIWMKTFSRVAISAMFFLSIGVFASAADNRGAHLGGARGTVHESNGATLEGIGVQLISAETAIRTTVYTNARGKYEFPVLDSGEYTLRIALPREYQPYVKEDVRIDGPSPLADIVLTRVSNTEFIPATAETLSQLTGSEWMLNLAGTGEQKRVFTLTCGFGCHSYQQIFRNRFDQRSWALILRKMMARGGGSPLILAEMPTTASIDRAHRPTLQDEALLSKWLSEVRGPDSQDEPIHFLPRPTGAATKVIITEYELPRELLAPHDVHGDSRGNIWYTAHRSPYAGVMDPRNGAIKEYRIPGKDADTPNVLPGTHRVWIDKNDIVWFSENWDHFLTALDPKTGQIVYRWKVEGGKLNGSAFSNFAMDDQGFVYDSRGDGVAKIDSKTGKIVQKWTYKDGTSGKYQDGATYDSIITPDGRYWSGGTPRGGLILDTKSGEMTMIESEGPDFVVGARGGFDAQDNAWFGGRGGMLYRMNARTHKISVWYSPVPYDTFYEALPDKNGEVWAAGLQSGRLMRFNPKTEQWTQYLLPEPYAHDRRTWIDNSTSPVTVWFVDHEGFMVRAQPLE
jgi:virginiamycin B lyase